MISRDCFEQRADVCVNPVAQRLCRLIAQKKTNLAIAADLTDQARILDLIHQVGSEICVLKTHIDIVSDFNPLFVQRLQELAKRYQFLIFEDRKFADIGKTVQRQYQGGIYQIAQWADIINAHALPGPGIIRSLKEIGKPLNRGLLLVAQMSSQLKTPIDYLDQTISLAQHHLDFVVGFIAQQKLTDHPALLHFTPGIHLEQHNVGDQNYVTPELAIERGSDVIIVGQGIYEAADPRQKAREYRQRAWAAISSFTSMV
jgi:uridine monophosphate synthetase